MGRGCGDEDEHEDDEDDDDEDDGLCALPLTLDAPAWVNQHTGHHIVEERVALWVRRWWQRWPRRRCLPNSH